MYVPSRLELEAAVSVPKKEEKGKEEKRKKNKTRIKKDGVDTGGTERQHQHQVWRGRRIRARM